MNPVNCQIDCLLHDHIDGSIAMLEILPELYRMSGKELPAYLRDYANLDEFHKKVIAWFSDPRIDIVTRFNLVTDVLQNKDTLHLAGYQYVRVRAGQKNRYCEGTIASHYHTRGDNKSNAKLTDKEAVDALVEGIKAGEKEFSAFEGNVLATIGRELIETKGEDEVLRIFRELSACDPAYVVGRGLVCDEAKYPPYLYVKVLNEARRRGYTVDPWCPHAGEWANLPGEDPNSLEVTARLLDNQRIAIYQMKAQRGEHFRLIYLDPELCSYMADHNIGVASCPESYSWMIKNYKELNLDLVRKKGVRVSLNPDDDLFMKGMPLVWQKCKEDYDFTEEDEFGFRVDAWKLHLGNRKPVPSDIAHLV